VFATEARLARGDTRAKLAWHSAQRAAILILLGIIVNSFPFFQLAHLRFYGVLQRIGVCYLVVGLFYLWHSRASTKVVALVVALVAALVGYWALVRWVPIPGIGVPGRDVPFMDMTQNLVSWIDRNLFPHHLYLDPPDHNARDPEGLLSDLPAVGTALTGILTGLWLRTQASIPAKSLGLAAASATSLVLGYLWSLEFPLNKNMWTSSFVLVAGGYSLALLALTFWAVEQKGWRKGWTWVWLVFGSNAIAAYLFSELAQSILQSIQLSDESGSRTALASWIAMHTVAHIPNPGWAAFGYSVFFTLFCFIPVWFLYRKKIFLKI
jgi:predicted acyltransferase